MQVDFLQKSLEVYMEQVVIQLQKAAKLRRFANPAASRYYTHTHTHTHTHTRARIVVALLPLQRHDNIYIYIYIYIHVYICGYIYMAVYGVYI